MNSMTIDDPRRARLEARLMERLRHLDDATLHELDEWMARPVGSASDDVSRDRPAVLMTRRRALVAILGGAAVAGAGLAGARVGETIGQTNGLAAGTAAGAAAGTAAMGDTISRLQGEAAVMGEQAAAVGQRFEDARNLLGLYDQLETVGLDSLVSGGLNAVATAIGRAAQTAQNLREGLSLAQNNINQLDEGFAVLDTGLSRLEDVVSGLSNLVQALEDRLRQAGEPVAPITDALGGFFTGLISKIPFGVGDSILATIERVQAVIGAIPEGIENINRDLIDPVRARFFPRDGDDVTVRLLDPLTNLIFLPADRLLGSLSSLGETWQNTLEAPAKEKLAARAEIREKIISFRAEKGL